MLGYNHRGHSHASNGAGRGRGYPYAGNGNGRGRGYPHAANGDGQGRGNFHGDGRGRGYYHAGNGDGRGRGSFHHGNDDDRGRGRGRGGDRGRGKWITDENIAEIATKRTTSLQVGSETTDDLLVAPALDVDTQHLANWCISKSDFDGFRSQKQVRDFVHSLLVNLSNHHGVDTSGLLTGLASENGRSRLREIFLRGMVINAGEDRNLTSFQYVVMPLVGVLTRENVCKSSLTQVSGDIYNEVYAHRYEFLEQGILPCMERLIHQGSMNDTSPWGDRLRRNEFLMQVPSLQHAMLAIVRLVYHLVKRLQAAKKEMTDTVNSVRAMATKCIQRSDNSVMSRFLNENLEKECQRLRSMISLPAPTVVAPVVNSGSYHHIQDANIVHLILNFDPPGSLSKEGCRHDNDHASIKDIQIAPTQGELICARPNFLPSNDVHGAPHHLPPGWSRLLDTHFRLNREDMIDLLRKGIVSFLEALRKVNPDRQGSLLNRRELRQLVGQDVAVYAYGNVVFRKTNTARHLQGSINITFDQPPQAVSESIRQRTIFWQRSKKRLMQGSLVCFIFPAQDDDEDVDLQESTKKSHRIHLCLGVVSYRDVREMNCDPYRAAINIVLQNHGDLNRFINARANGTRDVFMVESMGGFFEAYRPVLKALQTCEPGEMPFGKYLAPADDQKTDDAVAVVDPPMYARAPGFEFDLSVLLNHPATSKLDVLDPRSCQQAVTALRTHSNLDDTQSQALVDALRREVALISGPPGTGKTKIGVDLMRVLLHNADQMKCGPILCICFTNHALDQFLEHLLDQDIHHLVRIGSRSQSERLHQYNLSELMKASGKNYAVRSTLAQAYTAWDRALLSLEKIEKDVCRQRPLQVDVVRLLKMENYAQYEELKSGDGRSYLDDKPKSIEQNYERWSTGTDLIQMEKENRRRLKKWNKGSKHAEKRRERILMRLQNGDEEEWELMNELVDLDKFSERPELLDIPSTNRPLRVLRDVDLWTMSMQERQQLQDYWTTEVRDEAFNRHTQLMKHIRELSKTVDDAHDELRRNILRKAQVIGMTTNGAAKLQSMVAQLSPKIIICEEAGEVLESHILAALSGSTQHLILIGDHLQLRPQVATYELSSDSYQGRQYNLDRSLFERLVTTAKVPSSLLTTQRRMRPEICDLVRHTLYPELIDGERVLTYPDVFGMATNLFFMDHRHPEDSRDQYGTKSKANTFEAEMVRALVQHLVKNGYEHSNIAVLTPYLGQLSRLRDTLGQVAKLVIDERDQEQLDALENNGVSSKTPWKALSANRPLTLRTIDNYQGEEADIIIISLVRSDTREDEAVSSSTIGFLKSPNRTNVLLSRARHGMYLIGNAALMDQPQNGIWPDIMAEFIQTRRIGDGFPLRCRNHPETAMMVWNPEDFAIHAPNGGCTSSCDQVLSCGHICTMMCHWDDSDHQRFKCTQPCPRLHPQCNHICHKQCGQDCGDCTEPVGALDLPCGHTLARAFCFQITNPSRARCKQKVVRKLPHCEHDHSMDCYKDPDTFKCRMKCGETLKCGHACARQCHECQSHSLPDTDLIDHRPLGKINRTAHGNCQQKCGKMLHCGHICDAYCHLGADCPPCKQKCAFTCSHARCRHPCNDLCSACCEPCPWVCDHQGRCKLPCGSPCSRMPCDRRCEKLLSCGHQCPSVCGEDCPPARFCVQCRNDPTTMEMVVDMIMQAPLSEVDVNVDPILVLPCQHALTMSTLDNLMEMLNYYEGDMNLTTGAVSFVRTKALPNREVGMMGCPWCRTPITRLRRYGRRIKHSQLVMRLKKFEIQQSESITSAEAKFNAAQKTILAALPDFLKKICKFPSSQKAKAPKRSKSSPRGLGQFEVAGTEFPNSDVSSLFRSYDIHIVQERAWNDLIKPALNAREIFDTIRGEATTSPSRRLYEASVSHLYRFKSQVFYVDSAENGYTTVQWTPEESQRIRDECARECGLSPDFQAGSSLVRSIEGRTSVLLLILHAAFQAMNMGSAGGIHSGWYWFVRDLMECCLVHARIQRDAAAKGNYPRIEMYANMHLLDIYYKQMQWIGRRPFDKDDSGQQRIRKEAVDAVLKPFMDTLLLIRNSQNIGVRDECLPKARKLETRMVTMYEVAMCQRNQPLTQDEKFEVFRAVQATLGGSGHWYRCPNGHTYVIGDCGMAMQESTCPECGERIGGGSHRLREDNRRDEEFEGLNNQRTPRR
ncbi:hypothetical protein DFQ27_006824 [Actinomortierella ambigua]|uniref:RZ-type domain-containing protein n=1 Tax=Actinomortierella ambigua TaxID=1343610 RepID=A0A9P6PY78_9FUNG|nr:hypothetical protein DFQ27_006824 [Actinomortierella ambigua]